MMKEILQRIDLKKTYHTGFNPYDAVRIFAFMACFGLLHAVFASRRRWLPIALIVLSVASSAIVVWLARHHVVMEYNEWIRSGMPDHPI
jgi:disulfide bond formation protein DsbB